MLSAPAARSAPAAVFQRRVHIELREPQSGRKPKQQSRCHGNRDEIPDNAMVHGVIHNQPRRFLRHGERIRPHAPLGDPPAKDAASAREHQALDREAAG